MHYFYIFSPLCTKKKFSIKINFFLEDIPFSKCEINSYWLAKTFGTKIYNEFKNKTVLILGGNSDVGKFLAISFAKLESNLILTTRVKNQLEII